MGGLVSKQHAAAAPQPKRPAAISPQDRAVLDLKIQRDKLKQYAKRVISPFHLERGRIV